MTIGPPRRISVPNWRRSPRRLDVRRLRRTTQRSRTAPWFSHRRPDLPSCRCPVAFAFSLGCFEGALPCARVPSRIATHLAYSQQTQRFTANSSGEGPCSSIALCSCWHFFAYCLRSPCTRSLMRPGSHRRTQSLVRPYRSISVGVYAMTSTMCRQSHEMATRSASCSSACVTSILNSATFR